MIASAVKFPAVSCFDGSDSPFSASVLDGKERVGESAASACSRSLRLRSSPIDEAVALTAPIDSSVSAEMEEIEVEVDIVASVPAGTSVRPCWLAARCESSSGEREAMVDGGRTVKLTVLIDRRVACVGMKLGALFSPSEAEVKTPASSPASFADSRRIGDASKADPVGGPTVVGESKAATSATSSCGGRESCSAASSPVRSATPAIVGNPAMRAASEIPSPVERTPS